MLLGQKRAEKLSVPAASAQQLEALKQRYENPTLWDAFLHFLLLNHYQIPAAAIQRDFTQSILPNADLQRVLIKVYREDSLISEICEAMVDFDEGLQEWRYRHVKMVERTIGSKFGTGGSAGAAYLKTTLFQPLWPDLWEIRAEL